MPLPKKLVFRFLDCLPRLIAIEKLLDPIGREFSLSLPGKDKLEPALLPELDNEDEI